LDRACNGRRCYRPRSLVACCSTKITCAPNPERASHVSTCSAGQPTGHHRVSALSPPLRQQHRTRAWRRPPRGPPDIPRRFKLSFAKEGRVAIIAGAIDVICCVDHGPDVCQRDAPLVHVIVDVIGNLLWLPSPTEVVADHVCFTDECLMGVRRPREADRVQLSEVCVILAVVATAVAALPTRAVPAIIGMKV
jgi:hypothetical protein